MDRTEFLMRTEKRLQDAGMLHLYAAIVADADQYAAHMVEEYAHPHYGRWIKPASRPRRDGERLWPVTEVPGGER